MCFNERETILINPNDFLLGGSDTDVARSRGECDLYDLGRRDQYGPYCLP